MKIKVLKNPNTQSFAFISKSKPSAIEYKGVDRLKHCEFTCIVRALSPEKVEISLFVKFEPLIATSEREIRIAYPYPTLFLQEMVITARSLSNKNLYSAKY